MYLEVAANNPTWSNYQIAEALGVSEASVRRGLKAAEHKRYLIPTHRPERFAFDLDVPMEIYGPVMVTSDYHIPIYDPFLVNEMILIARELKIKQLIIGGDFFNYDQLSQFDPKQHDAHLDREHWEGHSVMSVLLETFDDIYYFWGNHDDRFGRALGFKLNFENIMRLVFGKLGEKALNRMHFSNLDHAWVKPYPGAPRDESWFVCHPKNYSTNPLTTARALTAKYKCNVITAHSHHCAIGPGVAENTIAIEAGGFHDKTKTAYLQRTTKFQEWTQGYCWLDENCKPSVRNPLWSTA